MCKVEENKMKLIYNSIKHNILIKELKTKVWDLMHEKSKKELDQILI